MSYGFLAIPRALAFRVDVKNQEGIPPDDHVKSQPQQHTPRKQLRDAAWIITDIINEGVPTNISPQTKNSRQISLHKTWNCPQNAYDPK